MLSPTMCQADIHRPCTNNWAKQAPSFPFSRRGDRGSESSNSKTDTGLSHSLVPWLVQAWDSSSGLSAPRLGPILGTGLPLRNGTRYPPRECPALGQRLSSSFTPWSSPGPEGQPPSNSVNAPPQIRKESTALGKVFASPPGRVRYRAQTTLGPSPMLCGPLCQGPCGWWKPGFWKQGEFRLCHLAAA